MIAQKTVGFHYRAWSYEAEMLSTLHATDVGCVKQATLFISWHWGLERGINSAHIHGFNQPSVHSIIQLASKYAVVVTCSSSINDSCEFKHIFTGLFLLWFKNLN